MSNDDGEKPYSFEDIEEIANFLRRKADIEPKIGLICGSGLGSMAEMIKDAVIIDYESIPNFPVSTIQGHAGKLIFGLIENTPVVCMQGRFHYYEGYPLWKCVMPIRLMKILGVSHLIISNAAGGLNPNLKIGDIMIIKDHINLMGFAGINPLRGENDHNFGPRFVSMSDSYNREIIEHVKKFAERAHLKDVVKEGTYTCLGGPNFETIAELNALKVMGVDAVGMSTVHEVLAAQHCGITTFAFSLISNLCVTDYDSTHEANSDHIIAVGDRHEGLLKTLIKNVVHYLEEHKFK